MATKGTSTLLLKRENLSVCFVCAEESFVTIYYTISWTMLVCIPRVPDNFSVGLTTPEQRTTIVVPLPL